MGHGPAEGGEMTTIVKIGGSLTRDAPPRELLGRLAQARGIVVVPGGGALADTVRDVQPQWHLPDSAAHRMAILAMEQMAHAFAALAPALVPAATPPALAAAAATGAALWLPAAMTLGHPGIPESWNVTSDSLSAWLAAEMNAARLVLVKAPGLALPAPTAHRTADLATWCRAGLVDAAFASMAQRFTGDIVLVAAHDTQGLEKVLEQKRPASEEPPARSVIRSD
ncbi:aspartate kinase [Xanthobacter sp. AM11]|uniref:amino acid kinase family protein n=1 Tax=Xanthobacter sp. AM11 TaxID=3380643 RepID=UPI0039BF1D26